jgi:hypothetical protein
MLVRWMGGPIPIGEGGEGKREKRMDSSKLPKNQRSTQIGGPTDVAAPTLTRDSTLPPWPIMLSMAVN